ncbi:MAG: hypothetical protein SFY96_13120 [Planctomycetota bacterium]|nr:hypothetical protein [Planctomycetota bacterium]
MDVVGFILVLVFAYAAVGVAFGAWFVTRGVIRLDPTVRTTPWSFRLLILPASAALWPYLATRLLKPQSVSASTLPSAPHHSRDAAQSEGHASDRGTGPGSGGGAQ